MVELCSMCEDQPGILHCKECDMYLCDAGGNNCDADMHGDAMYVDSLDSLVAPSFIVCFKRLAKHKRTKVGEEGSKEKTANDDLLGNLDLVCGFFVFCVDMFNGLTLVSCQIS